MSLRQDLRAHRAFLRARLKALARPGLRLPPGALDPRENGMYEDPGFYARLIARHGDIFKVSWGRHLLVCFARIADARAFLEANPEALRGISIDLTDLFPKGYVRNLDPPDHGFCRAAIAQALPDPAHSAFESGLRSIFSEELEAYARSCDADGPSRERLLRRLDNAATRALVFLLYGAGSDDTAGETLCALHHRLGPDGLAWKIGPREKTAFRGIRAELERQFDRPPTVPQSCLAGIAASGRADDTVLGNLIYMVEMGRYDLYAMFHWIVKHLGQSPETIQALLADPMPEGTAMPLCEAVVLESLRLDIVDGVQRRARRDIAWGRYFFSKGTLFRVCLGDAHKDAAVFDDPAAFRPRRFQDRRFSDDEFAPFGLDAHRCLGAGLAVGLGGLFVEELVHGFDLQAAGGDGHHRGAFHWEPGLDLSVTLRPRPPADRQA